MCIRDRPYTDDLARFSDLPHVFLKNGGQYEKREVLAARTYKQFVYLKIQGCGDRNTAEAFRGKTLYIDRENAAPLPEGAHYIADLIGLLVVNDAGKQLGTLKEVLQHGAADVYVVEGDKPFLFPAVPGVIIRTDIAGGTIIVDGKRLQEVAVL